jgi:hypothetical protein
MQTDSEKILALRTYSNMSWVDLCKKLGIKSTQTFMDIKNGRIGISARMKKLILAAFPEINPLWLNNLEEEMLLQGKVGYSAPPAAHMAYSSIPNAAINLNAIFPKADSALSYSGDDMEDYPRGSMLILRRLMSVALLVPGRNYVIQTPDYCIVRRLVNTGAECMHFISTSQEKNPDGTQKYAPIDVPMRQVNAVFSVLGYVCSEDDGALFNV